MTLSSSTTSTSGLTTMTNMIRVVCVLIIFCTHTSVAILNVSSIKCSTDYITGNIALLYSQGLNTLVLGLTSSDNATIRLPTFREARIFPLEKGHILVIGRSTADSHLQYTTVNSELLAKLQLTTLPNPVSLGSVPEDMPENMYMNESHVIVAPQYAYTVTKNPEYKDNDPSQTAYTLKHDPITVTSKECFNETNKRCIPKMVADPKGNIAQYWLNNTFIQQLFILGNYRFYYYNPSNVTNGLTPVLMLDNCKQPVCIKRFQTGSSTKVLGGFTLVLNEFAPAVDTDPFYISLLSKYPASKGSCATLTDECFDPFKPTFNNCIGSIYGMSGCVEPVNEGIRAGFYVALGFSGFLTLLFAVMLTIICIVERSKKKRKQAEGETLAQTTGGGEAPAANATVFNFKL